MTENRPASLRFLIVRSDAFLCALPLEHVAETMRPLPVEPLAGMPSFLLGVSIIRGGAVPVVDAARLLGSAPTAPGRFVTVRLGETRRVALAVDGVIGVRELPESSLDHLPPLIRNANAEAISAVSTLDAELLLVLRGARLVPEPVWHAIESEGDRT